MKKTDTHKGKLVLQEKKEVCVLGKVTVYAEPESWVRAYDPFVQQYRSPHDGTVDHKVRCGKWNKQARVRVGRTFY